MVQEKFILRIIGYVLTLFGAFTLGFGGFAKGHVEKWILDFTGIVGVILLINGITLLIRSTWKK